MSNKADQITLRASHPRTMLDLALQDVGQIVLPRFIGDCEVGLIRTGDIIPSLTHDQWLVVHGEEREFSAVRSTIASLMKAIKERCALFEGNIV